jgi:predicted amidohydrolase YtcJ
MSDIVFRFLVGFALLEAPDRAELAFVNATVHTLDRKQPIAQAFAVQGGKFAAVGTHATVSGMIGPNTRVIDLQGRTVIPGLIDAHVHPRPIFDENSRWYSIEAGPDKTKSIDDLIKAVRRKAKITPKGQWITGFGYEETKLGRHPTCHDLDLATTDHPVMIRHSSGHLSVCNSAALQAANITSATPNPDGGQFERDSNG